MLLVRNIYLLTRHFPGDEKFGLISQMRRAAVSVPSNIAEGQARHSTASLSNLFLTPRGSVAELDTQLTIAVDLGYCDEAEVKPLFDLVLELRKMLNGLRRKLQGR